MSFHCHVFVPRHSPEQQLWRAQWAVAEQWLMGRESTESALKTQLQIENWAADSGKYMS